MLAWNPRSCSVESQSGQGLESRGASCRSGTLHPQHSSATWGCQGPGIRPPLHRKRGLSPLQRHPRSMNSPGNHQKRPGPRLHEQKLPAIFSDRPAPDCIPTQHQSAPAPFASHNPVAASIGWMSSPAMVK